MVHARFRINLPADTWIADVSERHDSALFRLLAGLQIGGRVVELGEVVSESPDMVVREMENHEAIESVNRLGRSERRLLVRYESRDTALYAFAEEVALPLQFPIIVQAGWYVFELTGTQGEFDRVRTLLAEADCGFELLSIVGERPDADVLTDRQRNVLGAAVQRGYFSVPRECTLSDFAVQFEADESTLSGVIRRGTERVLSSYFAHEGSES